MTDKNEQESSNESCLSRPVVGDEQMREALKIASSFDHLNKKGRAAVLLAAELGDVSRALLAMSEQLEELDKFKADYERLSDAFVEQSEQLAEAQEKVKALQPYKDAYEGGEDMFALHENETFMAMHDSCGEAMNDCHARNAEEHPYLPWSVKTVRVCKLVEGDG